MKWQMVRWAIAVTLLAAVGTPAWAATAVTMNFKKTADGDSVVQDTIIAWGIADGNASGASDVARMNNGGRGGDTIGVFSNRNWHALMKWNPTAPDVTGTHTMPAPGTVESATLRLHWIKSLNTIADDMIIAALKNDDDTAVITNDTWFGDQNEEYQNAGIASGITTDNGFNGGTCNDADVSTCGPKNGRDFWATAADTNKTDLNNLINEDTFTAVDHDVTDLFNNGALTGLGVFIGTINQSVQGRGANLRLSENNDVSLRPELILTIPEPASATLLVLGGLALMPRRRR